MPDLTPDLRRTLRAQAHHLHPVVSIAGNGLTPAVLTEIERNLAAHALIKVRVYGVDRHQRAAWMHEICKQTGAAAVQHIGNILILWRETPEPEQTAKPPVRRPARPAANGGGARKTPASARARTPRNASTRNTRAKPHAKRR